MLIKIPQIVDDTRYWLVRTSTGTNYANFINNNVVQIGWSFIESVPEKMTREYKKSMKVYEDENLKSIGNVLGNIHRFQHDIRVGDFIVSPGYNTTVATEQVYSIGIVRSEMKYITVEGERIKTREVEWVSKHNSKKSISIFFKQIFYRQSTVSEITDYSNYINIQVYPIHYYYDKLYILTKVKDKKEIKNRTYSKLFGFFDEVIPNSRDLDITSKVSIQSPGIIITAIGGSIALVAVAGAYAYSIIKKANAESTMIEKADEAVVETSIKIGDMHHTHRATYTKKSIDDSTIKYKELQNEIDFQMIDNNTIEEEEL